ncbi:acyl-CoA dehydrogenase [Bordetella genomosp. 12]|uniref:Acyl-CoA dehydrogenase n=2 Tax=Bordetella genomosp. 12 TaxID=463035 RepID=A0A261VB14_9BORD|nr:acyl-CoA dehydrogenase [Bordetella genomosp. 12]
MGAGKVFVGAALAQWLNEHAATLDSEPGAGAQLLPRLASEGLFGLGVATEFGGRAGSDIGHAIEAIAELASHSLTAAFVAWAQRVVIETVARGANKPLADACLPDLLAGRLAGASGLSNAIKSLSGIDSLRIHASETPRGWKLNGRIDWITNARPEGFLATAATSLPDGSMAIVALRSETEGLVRHPDLPLLGLRASSTCALDLNNLVLTPAGLIHLDARQVLPGLRPVLVGLQCGLAIGLARASLRAAEPGQAAVLGQARQHLAGNLQALSAELVQGVRQARFIQQPARLFALRIALAELAQQAAELELQAAGGKAWLQSDTNGFARRWREAAFLPVVTPSLVQLKTELARLAAQSA